MKQLRDGRGKSRDSQRSPSLSFSVSLAFLQFNWTIGISNGKYASITEGFNMTAGAWSFQWGLCCADIWYNALREGKLFFGNLKFFIEIQIMLKDLLIFRWFVFDNFDRSELYFFFFPNLFNAFGWRTCNTGRSRISWRRCFSSRSGITWYIKFRNRRKLTF